MLTGSSISSIDTMLLEALLSAQAQIESLHATTTCENSERTLSEPFSSGRPPKVLFSPLDIKNVGTQVEQFASATEQSGPEYASQVAAKESRIMQLEQEAETLRASLRSLCEMITEATYLIAELRSIDNLSSRIDGSRDVQPSLAESAALST